jgi:uncharacterized SAM-binding protein YcdF (DUF218 family)
MTRRKFWLSALLCVAVGGWLFSNPILRGIGSLLVNDGPPVTSDAIVVLAGDMPGRRVLKGAELAREGFAPVAVVSNSGSMFGHKESEMGVAYAIDHGYSPSMLVAAQWTSNSTVTEAQAAVREMRSRRAHKVIVVTSIWHTARAGRVYRRIAPDLEIHMVGSVDPKWHNGYWWTDREGQKVFLQEAIKTVADFLRI